VLTGNERLYGVFPRCSSPESPDLVVVREEREGLMLVLVYGKARQRKVRKVLVV
jgi:hypothetical protein